MKNYKLVFIAMIIIALAFNANLLSAQGRKPQNIYRVAVRSWYAIEDGKRTSTFFAAEQKIADSLGRLHTEIEFDKLNNAASKYKWHYFDSLTKVQTRFFNSEGLFRIEEYIHDKDDRITRLNIKNITPGDTSLYMSLIYKYNPNGTVASVKGLNAKGKKGYEAKFKYDTRGTEIERKVKGSKLIPADSILYLKREPAYDSLGRIVSEVIKTNKFGKGEQTNTYSYKFNDKGLLVEKGISDGLGNLTNRVEYIYRSDKRLNQIIVYDAKGNLLNHEAWRYEIYKTNDRRQRILE